MIYYVNANAGREGNGSKEMPFRRIGDAAKIAVAGDEILVAPGIYREYVNPVHGGTEERRIVYRSTEPLGAVITGAEPLTGWTRHEGNVWVRCVPNGLFGDYNPYTTYVCGDWYFAPTVRHTGSVFLNDRMMYETADLAACAAGEPDPCAWDQEDARYLWYTEQDGDETVLYANFQGLDPNAEKVEFTVRRRCFMPEETGVGYITVSGFDINKAATTWAPPASYQDGMIGPHWSKGWIIEDCEIWGSRCCGISLGKYRDPENDMYFYTKHVKSPTQMERDAVCRGQYHGWTKERIGSHIVRRCHIHHCEQAGIVGRMGGVFSLIEDNHIHHINCMQELAGAEVAGIKLHAAIDVTIRRNHIHHSTMGLWCDWQAQGTRITCNLFHDNNPPSEDIPRVPGGMPSCDVFIEVSHGPTLIDHNVSLSRVSFKLASQGVALVHNLCLGPLTSIGSGTDMPLSDGGVFQRYTPYHIPHRTEVAGMMTFLHGDDRIYNNIFLQNWPVKAEETRRDMGFQMRDNQVQGTAVFDDYPTYEEWIGHFDLDNPQPDMMALQDWHFKKLPVWINGNAYFGGAQSWKHEKDRFLGGDAYARLIEKEGRLYLDTNVYALLDGWSSDLIDSDTLGEAFEPSQRFENPDGSAIVFDRDYFGNHRALSAAPGPFADAEAAKRPL
jgi:hypothetical protein